MFNKFLFLSITVFPNFSELISIPPKIPFKFSSLSVPKALCSIFLNKSFKISFKFSLSLLAFFKTFLNNWEG